MKGNKKGAEKILWTFSFCNPFLLHPKGCSELLGSHWSSFYGLAPSLTESNKATASGTSYWEHTVAETRDGNVTWTPRTTNAGPMDLVRDPVWEDRLFGAHPNADTNHGGVILSEDGGSTWTEYLVGWTGSIAVVPQ